MTDLQNHQFEILPSAEASDGFVFGIGADISVNEDGFDPGENVWITQDTQNTRRGVAAFGRDVLGNKTWTWSSHCNRDDVYEAVETMEDFAGAWQPDLLVRNPGEIVALRYRIANRDRRVFGRPRRLAMPTTNQILNGYNEIDHDFALVDAFTYDDLETQEQFPFYSAATGNGWTMPVIMPILSNAGTGSGHGQITVGGNARAYPRVRFYGPWVDPAVDFGTWKLRWTGTILAGGFIEIDTRPWRLTVLDESGASRVAGLDRQTWLEDCYFPPSTQPQATLTGTSSAGGAYCQISWRNAWKSI